MAKEGGGEGRACRGRGGVTAGLRRPDCAKFFVAQEVFVSIFFYRECYLHCGSINSVFTIVTVVADMRPPLMMIIMSITIIINIIKAMIISRIIIINIIKMITETIFAYVNSVSAHKATFAIPNIENGNIQPSSLLFHLHDTRIITKKIF